MQLICIKKADEGGEESKASWRETESMLYRNSGWCARVHINHCTSAEDEMLHPQHVISSEMEKAITSIVGLVCLLTLFMLSLELVAQHQSGRWKIFQNILFRWGTKKNFIELISQGDLKVFSQKV